VLAYLSKEFRAFDWVFYFTKFIGLGSVMYKRGSLIFISASN